MQETGTLSWSQSGMLGRSEESWWFLCLSFWCTGLVSYLKPYAGFHGDLSYSRFLQNWTAVGRGFPVARHARSWHWTSCFLSRVLLEDFKSLCSESWWFSLAVQSPGPCECLRHRTRAPDRSFYPCIANASLWLFGCIRLWYCARFRSSSWARCQL